MEISDIGEEGLIERIRKRVKYDDRFILKGIGDDSAVIRLEDWKNLLLTTDLLIEDIHFDLNFIDPYRLGKKSLAVNLSDIAAMGGNPKYFNVSLGIPSKLSVEFVDEFYSGLIDIARIYNVSLIGGDISRSDNKLVIDIALIGEGDNIILRNGAKNGDQIFVTGELGDSVFGLKILKGCYKIKNERFIGKHLEPIPRINEGRFLAKINLPTAMIDISDGLIKDLGHILKESNVGAKVWMDKIPFSKDILNVIDIEEAWNLVLTGGEDYELLFTAKKNRVPELIKISNEYNIKISHIGEIKGDKNRIEFLLKNGMIYNPAGYGYDHFSN